MDGRELFYLNRNDARMMVVPINTEPTLRAGTAEVLFDWSYQWVGGSFMNYDVTSDGQRFLVAKDDTSETASLIHRPALVRGTAAAGADGLTAHAARSDRRSAFLKKRSLPRGDAQALQQFPPNDIAVGFQRTQLLFHHPKQAARLLQLDLDLSSALFHGHPLCLDFSPTSPWRRLTGFPTRQIAQ